MPALPNPFYDSADEVMPSAEEAVAPQNVPNAPGAAATFFESVAPYPHATVTAAASLDAEMREVAADSRFVLDVEAFMEAIEPPPLFLQRVPREVLKILAWR